MDEYIKREHAIDAVLNALCGTVYQSKVVNAIKYDVPTVDVAKELERVEALYFQKDEQVKQLKLDIEAMRTEADIHRGHYKKIKSNVAKEIIEDIEKHLQEKKTAISMFKDDKDDFYDGEIHALDRFGHFLAEFKKQLEKGGLWGKTIFGSEEEAKEMIERLKK